MAFTEWPLACSGTAERQSLVIDWQNWVAFNRQILVLKGDMGCQKAKFVQYLAAANFG